MKGTPTASKPQVLLIEDNPVLIRVYQRYLHSEPCHLTQVSTGAEALLHLERQPPAVVLLDLNLPDINGLEILRYISDCGLPSTVVVITAHASIDIAVAAMRAGAFDFLVKPFDGNRLTVTLRNALERQRLLRLVATLREEGAQGYHGFIGGSLAMQAVYRIIDSAAPSKATVFITGESGTGKELCAEAIHKQGTRRDQPFIALNCGAIPHDLMESEIFGHVRGAFTGAAGDRKGAAALAHGGTLFLDEIGELDLDLQKKLLRFVQTGTFQPVGSSQIDKVDVRFVCATNRDPLADVEAGRFREDLYYRLHVIPIVMPPLRERDDDVLTIAQHFLEKYAAEEGRQFRALSPETQAIFLDYDWPGNVRQLQNVLRNIVVLHDADTVTPGMLPPPLNRLPPPLLTAVVRRECPSLLEDVQSESQIRPLDEVEREVIEQAIELCGGNIPRAAARLGVAPSTIYRKRQSWAERDLHDPAQRVGTNG